MPVPVFSAFLKTDSARIMALALVCRVTKKICRSNSGLFFGLKSWTIANIFGFFVGLLLASPGQVVNWLAAVSAVCELWANAFKFLNQGKVVCEAGTRCFGSGTESSALLLLHNVIRVIWDGTRGRYKMVLYTVWSWSGEKESATNQWHTTNFGKGCGMRELERVTVMANSSTSIMILSIYTWTGMRILWWFYFSTWIHSLYYARRMMGPR